MAKHKRRAFTREFKAETVRLIQEGGKTVKQVCRDLDLIESAVRSWIRQAEIDEGHGPKGALMSSERDELARLRPQNRQLLIEREILRSDNLLRQGEPVKHAFIAAEKPSIQSRCCVGCCG